MGPILIRGWPARPVDREHEWAEACNPRIAPELVVLLLHEAADEDVARALDASARRAGVARALDVGRVGALQSDAGERGAEVDDGDDEPQRGEDREADWVTWLTWRAVSTTPWLRGESG